MLLSSSARRITALIAPLSAAMVGNAHQDAWMSHYTGYRHADIKWLLFRFSEFLDSIEDSLYLHPVPFSLIDGSVVTSIFSEREQDALPFKSQKNYRYRNEFSMFSSINFPEELYITLPEVLIICVA